MHSTLQPTQHTNPKCITSQQLLILFSKTQMNKERLLKQLQQLDINIQPLQYLSLSEIHIQVQTIMKNTYSIKYLGLNKNQMGIVSRRIDPTKDCDTILNQAPTLTYTINKYFYPKPLKVGKKSPKQEQINVYNLQNEIKRSFQNKNNKIKIKTRNNLMQSSAFLQKKKQVHGSWLSIGKIKNTIYNQKKEKLKHVDPNRINLNQIPQGNIKSTGSSYAKFLSKGVILVKDC